MVDDSGTPLEATAGEASQRAVDAFELLGNETRLSILLALWESYEPRVDDGAVAFSDLRDAVGIRQGAQFNYHLDKLVGRYVEKSEEGYELRPSGHRIVRSVIAGAGIEGPSSDPVEIGVTCHLCDAPAAVTYRDEWLYLVCTECDGAFEGDDRPDGMLTGVEFDPAGLVDRDAERQWRAAWLVGKSMVQLAAEGVCNECSGPMDRSIDVCTDHARDGPCERCGRQFAVMVQFQCPVCKNHHEAAPRTLLVHHPAVISFYHERGVNFQYDDGRIESLHRRGELISDHEQELVSADPLRIRVTVRYDGDELRLTLDEDLTVVDSERTADE